MNSSDSGNRAPCAACVKITDDTLTVDLADGRTISVPILWYPRLAKASARERKSWRFVGKGAGIHWPQIDEDVSVANLLNGQPSADSPTSFKKWLEGRKGTHRSRKSPGKDV